MKYVLSALIVLFSSVASAGGKLVCAVVGPSAVEAGQIYEFVASVSGGKGAYNYVIAIYDMTTGQVYDAATKENTEANAVKVNITFGPGEYAVVASIYEPVTKGNINSYQQIKTCQAVLQVTSGTGL